MRGRRLMAVGALASLAVLVAIVLGLLILSGGLLAAVLPIFVVVLVMAGAALWWAFTTRRRWKRRANVAAAAVVLAAFLLGAALLGLRYPAVVLGIVLAVVAYGVAGRRALAGPDQGWSPPAVPPSRPWLLVNARSGGGKAERLGLAAAAERQGVTVRLLQPGDDVAALARAAVAAGADAVGVAGGDGSLGLVAAVAIEAGVPFVCIPTGTRNHFARDIGLDRSRPLAALAAFAGLERRIDVGLVGERTFLNNVSVGAYAAVVAEPGYRAAKFATAHAVLPATLRGTRPPLGLTVRDPEGRAYPDPLVLLVANNRYGTQGSLTVGSRNRLDEGVLEVSILRIATGAELGGALARAFGRVTDHSGRWAQWTTRALQLDTTAATAPDLADQATVPVGIDGESATLAAPLAFRVLPQALSVLVPAGVGLSVVRSAFGPAAVRSLWAIAVKGAG